MRWLWSLLLVAACAAGETTKRWPEHRKRGDARFAELERRAEQLEARVEALSKELTAARAELARLSAPPSAPAPSAPAAQPP
jgi:chromosome segregation ATPase